MFLPFAILLLASVGCFELGLSSVSSDISPTEPIQTPPEVITYFQENPKEFKAIVFAWRRLASLKRLVESLENAEYHGFKVNLEFHVDGEPEPVVQEFVENYNWPHGTVRRNIQSRRLGLAGVCFCNLYLPL